jgi:hypothetical protein
MEWPEAGKGDLPDALVAFHTILTLGNLIYKLMVIIKFVFFVNVTRVVSHGRTSPPY